MRHPNQVTKPPELGLSDTKEQLLYFNLLLGLLTPHPISKVYAQSHSFCHYPKIMTTGSWLHLLVQFILRHKPQLTSCSSIFPSPVNKTQNAWNPSLCAMPSSVWWLTLVIIEKPAVGWTQVTFNSLIWNKHILKKKKGSNFQIFRLTRIRSEWDDES